MGMRELALQDPDFIPTIIFCGVIILAGIGLWLWMIRKEKIRNHNPLSDTISEEYRNHSPDEKWPGRNLGD